MNYSTTVSTARRSTTSSTRATSPTSRAWPGRRRAASWAACASSSGRARTRRTRRRRFLLDKELMSSRTNEVCVNDSDFFPDSRSGLHVTSKSPWIVNGFYSSRQSHHHHLHNVKHFTATLTLYMIRTWLGHKDLSYLLNSWSVRLKEINGVCLMLQTKKVCNCKASSSSLIGGSGCGVGGHGRPTPRQLHQGTNNAFVKVRSDCPLTLLSLRAGCERTLTTFSFVFKHSRPNVVDVH